MRDKLLIEIDREAYDCLRSVQRENESAGEAIKRVIGRRYSAEAWLADIAEVPPLSDETIGLLEDTVAARRGGVRDDVEGSTADGRDADGRGAERPDAPVRASA